MLTHVDDRFDTAIRDKIGADTPRLPCRSCHLIDLTFLLEDPATIWNLGPQRYPQIASSRYANLTNTRGRLAIDVNIVRTLSGRLSDQEADWNGTIRTRPRGCKFLCARGALFREFDRRGRLSSACLLPLHLALYGPNQDGSRLTVQAFGGVGIPLEGPRVSRRPRLARSQRHDGLVALWHPHDPAGGKTRPLPIAGV